MGIYERLMHLEEPSLPAHYVAAAINDIIFGSQTAAAMKAAFGLTLAEGVELDVLLATITGNLATRAMRVNEIHYVLMLGEGKIFYATGAAVRLRLGVP